MTYSEKRENNKTVIESKDIIMNLVRELLPMTRHLRLLNAY